MQNLKEKASCTAGDNFCDILLIGETGIGKSTTAEKLLEWYKYRDKIKSVNLKASETSITLKPESGSGFKDVTLEFQAWENADTKVRVLDAPGFANTQRHCLLDVGKKNLAIVYRIARLTEIFNFRRILYFLPTRGVPERADGVLKEELQLLYKFFGDLIFNLMVVVCTNHPDPRYQNLEFRPDDLKAVKKVFNSAVMDITGKDYSTVEVVYIPVNATSETIIHRVKKKYQGEGLTVDAKAACVKCQGNDRIITLWKQLFCGSMCHPKFVRKKKSENVDAMSHDEARTYMSKDEMLIYDFYCDSECDKCGSPPGTVGCTRTNSNIYHTTIIEDLDDITEMRTCKSSEEKHPPALATESEIQRTTSKDSV